ncbi:nitrite/sulfite reductase [Ectothiorhodospira haloalkaliphila]|uniref:nitrite/sulfite reductase n=1 Tax=Ectothiorhodospira haloalkaliphila TaxID=421628 RepID=UPI0004B7C05E|nr:nitrite/sulfite reductase [Ectothiorhodospira haloalkaliphila]
MYQYSEWDQALLRERVEQFRDQTRRFLSGQLSEEAYRPLRLMNGLYIQRHAPMLRVAIPYGLLSSTQLRGLARVARDHDRGFGHFTTRQNIQFNWLELEQVPEVLASLAEVGLHAIQTSGNCIRNVTCDPLAGLTPEEVDNPLPWCEVVRQWATLHPEFSYLPRKFKIAVTASLQDRAATRIHDVGLQLVRGASGEPGFRISVGGGLGRDPHLARTLRAWLPADDLLDYLTAILRVYNLHGRRDNLYKARSQGAGEQCGSSGLQGAGGIGVGPHPPGTTGVRPGGPSPDQRTVCHARLQGGRPIPAPCSTSQCEQRIRDSL